MPYFPCLAHRVNTTVEHSCDASVAVCHMFDILQELFVFFTSSTKRYNVFREKVKESDVDGTLELRNLSATRWSARADSIRAVWSSYEEIVKSLEELQDADDTKTKAKAKNLLARVKPFEFIVMVMFIRNVMVKTKILTKQIQSVDINIVDTLRLLLPHCATYATTRIIWTTKYIQLLFFQNAMKSMLLLNTSVIIVHDARREGSTKDQKQQHTLISRTSTENNFFKSWTSKSILSQITSKLPVTSLPRLLVFSFHLTTKTQNRKSSSPW